MNGIIAIDTGGTKCDALLVTDDGLVLGSGHSEQPGRGGRTIDAVTEAVREAITDRSFDRLLVSTISSSLPTVTFSLSALQVQLRPCSEELAAFHLADVGAGVAVLSGTGAFVAARDEAGKQRRIDGMGPLLGDDGSGYQIGQAALRAVVRTSNHPRHRTRLRSAILADMQITHPGYLLRTFNTEVDRSAVARFSRFVDQAAREGDEVAIEILQRAAHVLAENVMDMVDIMKMRDRPYPLVGFGSVITGSELFWGMLRERVSMVAPELEPMRPAYKPVVGMAVEGLRQIHCDDDDAFSLARAGLLAAADRTPFTLSFTTGTEPVP